MKHYIIDGNNLIGKIKKLFILQKKDKQVTRIKLAFMIDNYFAGKNANVTLHFDGYESDTIYTNKCKIIYSDSRTADEKIKKQIERSKNRKNLVVVTSDGNLAQFASVCSCTIIACDKFAASMKGSKPDDENSIIDDLKRNSGEFARLFGVDDDPE